MKSRFSIIPAALAVLIAATSISGCGMLGRNKDTAEPPAELVDFEPTVRVRKVWSGKVGGDSERLRLNLRPASDGARIYAGAHDGQVAAFDAETGRKIWSVKTRLPLSAGPAYGEGALAFGTTDGQLLLLDAQNGEELWREEVGSEVLAPPAIAPNVVVLRTVDGRLRGFSLRDGNMLWSVEQVPPALTLRGNTAPRVAGAIVVAGFSNGRIGAYEVGNGEPVWELTLATPSGRSELERLVDIGTGMQVIGNDVYVAGYRGRAVAVDLTTGVVLWQQEMSSYAGLGADVNNVYVTNDVDTIIALNRSGGAQLWRQDALRLRDVTAAARYADTIVVGDFEGYLHWLDPNDGRFVARARAASDRITAAPLVVGQTLFAQSDDGSVAAYSVFEPTPRSARTARNASAE